MKKRKQFFNYPLILLGGLLMLSISCNKENNNQSEPTYGKNIPILFNPNKTYGTIADIDGNVYKTIIIGTQTWMAENLKTTRYNNGTTIPYVTDDKAWLDLTTSATPAYCWYKNDTSYKTIYGALYNWYTVNTGILSPAGWHVPTDDEWDTLVNYLGGTPIAGYKLKETGTNHWSTSGSFEDNGSGFTAVPGGFRNYNASFNNIGDDGYWWSSSESIYKSITPKNAWYWNLDSHLGLANRSGDYYKSSGFSVRCIKN
jgi:uncharacterized protein (TIGR02145 family)